MTSYGVGIIAEDATDCETIKVIIQRLLPQSTPRIKARHADGCGNIFRKGAQWASDLLECGCNALILVKDLDRTPTGQLNSYDHLLSRMQNLHLPKTMQTHCCVPIEEIEAWFWADQRTVDKVASSGGGHAHAQPERIPSPKEALIRISRDNKRRARYSTLRNPDLARTLDMGLCAERCPSFAKLCAFIRQLC